MEKMTPELSRQRMANLTPEEIQETIATLQANTMRYENRPRVHVYFHRHDHCTVWLIPADIFNTKPYPEWPLDYRFHGVMVWDDGYTRVSNADGHWHHWDDETFFPFDHFDHALAYALMLVHVRQLEEIEKSINSPLAPSRPPN